MIETRADLLEEYIEKLGNLDQPNEQSAFQLNDITSEDEIWLFQCPKSLNLENFNNKTLKFPGKSSHGNVQFICERAGKPSKITLATRNEEAYKVGNFLLEGYCLVKEKEILVKIENFQEEILKNKVKNEVLFPSNIKQRHPLHGADYHDKIVLPKKIRRKLTDHKTYIKIENDSDKYQEPKENRKKSSKRKRKHSNSNNLTFEEGLNKKIKLELCASDLEWIKST